MESIWCLHLSRRKGFLDGAKLKVYVQNYKALWCLTVGRIRPRWNKRASASSSSFPSLIHFFFFLLSKHGIIILRLSLSPHVYSKRTLGLFNLKLVFSFQNVFFLSPLPVYKKCTVIVVMQDSYLYCNPQSPVSVEIMCLKQRPIINWTIIFKWLLTSGSWNQKLYK